ncbi:MAG: hypothetical protein H0X62_08170 [Bacteroidetes bacterium]|nr:hypothetical protein [Bacteroidota bacterium]
MEDKNIVDIKTKIASLSVAEFIVEEQAKKVSIDVDTVLYEYNVSANIDKAKKNVTIDCKIGIYYNKEKDLKLGSIATIGIFDILNLDEILEKFDDNIPIGIFHMFLGVVISTTRGFLLSKAENTPLEGATIPIIDIKSFFKSGGIASIDSEIVSGSKD